jgi:hypothetical protein
MKQKFTKVSVSGVNGDFECFERGNVLWALSSPEDVSVLMKFGATSQFAE